MTDWAVVFATFIGPIAAVVVTRLLDDYRFKNERKYSVFRALMSTRTTTLSPLHVSNINLVEVEFYKEKLVIDAWETYIRHLNEYPRGEFNAELDAKWEFKRRDLLAIMLTRIAQSLGLAKGELEIRNGGYTPDGWRWREADQDKALKFAVALSEGNASVPFRIVPDDGQPPK